MMDCSFSKKRALIVEARRWVGMGEVGGDNKGQLVTYWQKQIDGVAQGEAWCAAFALSHVKWVDFFFYQVYGENNFSKIFLSEHVRTVWKNTPDYLKSKTPVPGHIVCWGYKGTDKGHMGVVSALKDVRTFASIEGNTSPGAGIIREGDVVAEKLHTMEGSPSMELLGFISPWA